MASRSDSRPRRRLDTEERRDAILDAARSAYAEAAYAEVPASRIAEAAGASTALIFHYFGSKAGLYTAVVQDAVDRVADRQREADEALPPNTSSRDRVRVALLISLDHIARHPRTWALPLQGGEEPREAIELRRAVRVRCVEALRRLLGVHGWARHEFALWGYFGFVEQACLAWVEAGCPAASRDLLVEASLGALEGALGDWGV